jgi:hypothetical protein
MFPGDSGTEAIVMIGDSAEENGQDRSAAQRRRHPVARRNWHDDAGCFERLIARRCKTDRR